MKIVAYAGSFAAGTEYAKEKYPNHYVSVQHCGQGWQMHKWVVILTGRKP